MTLIVGVRCSDGIVVGADGAATFGSMGMTTIRQPVKKLSIVDGCVIVGVAGPIGLAQRITGTLSVLRRENKLANKEPFDAMTITRQNIGPHLIMEIQAGAEASKLVGQGLASQSALCHSVIAMPLKNKACLFQFDHQGAPEEASEDLPFIAIGSGQALADPFLAFIRRVFWRQAVPSLAQGLFAVVWSLDHAIKTNPGGVAEPMQLALLRQHNDRWEAKEIASEELEEHKQAIVDAEAHLAEFKKRISDPTDAEPPPSP